MNEAIQSLLTAFNLIAPTGKEQAAMVSRINEMRDWDASDPEIILGIANAIVDGLTYGNWP